MSRGFIFTMDAVLSLIPLFIVLGAISHTGGGGGLYLQGQLLGTERMAQDTLRILQVRGDIKSINATELNTTLRWIIPSYLNYSYVVIDKDTGTASVNLTRGAPSNKTDVIPSGNVITIGAVAQNVTVLPNILVKNFVETQEEADAFTTLLLALVGLTSHGGNGAIVTDLPTVTEWGEVAEITVRLSDFSTYWGTSNNTLDFMLDQLITTANAQEKTNAVTGLTQLKLILDNASRGSLNYSISTILDPYPVPSGYENMTVGGSDLVYTAFQSANYNLGVNTSTNVSSSDGNYRLRVYAKMEQPGKVYVATKYSVIYSEIGNMTVEVWQKKSVDDNYTLNDTLRIRTLRKACFNLTDIRLQSLTSGVLTIDVTSAACSPSGLINVTIKNETTSSSASMNLNEYLRSLAPNLYSGVPMVESALIFNGTATGTTFYYNYINSVSAAGDELDGVLNQLPLDAASLSGSNSFAEKKGQINVGSVIYRLKYYMITLKLWGD